MNKYRIDWIDFSKDANGKSRKTTIKAKDMHDAVSKFYKKFPKGRCPSVSLA